MPTNDSDITQHEKPRMSRYRGEPEAIRALVQEDRVHRNLYLSDELFAQEQDHFFANTWNDLGLAIQVPSPGDFLSPWMSPGARC